MSFTTPHAFAEAVTRGMKAAEAGYLVTFGIIPTAPETGYGYIQAGAESSDGVRQLQQFVEKPNRETAEKYLASGEYLWNSGMFLLRADVYLQELEQHAPAILAAVRRALDGARNDLDFSRLDATAFATCPSDSIDYAVMERTQKGVVVPLSCGWSDVGSWSSLWEVEPKDESDNVLIGDVVAARCRLELYSQRIASGGCHRFARCGDRRNIRRRTGGG